MPEGWCRLRLAAIERRDGPSGYPHFRLVAECLEHLDGGPVAGMVVDCVSLSPAFRARRRLDAFLDALGFPPVGRVRLKERVGTALWARVHHDSLAGRVRRRIVAYAPPHAEPMLRHLGRSAFAAFFDARTHGECVKAALVAFGH